jgi:hypothetical protein
LGAGDDGHTSSIFPGQEELLTSASVYVVSINPRNGQKRIAMTGYPILNARHVIFLITGKGKADVVEEICKSGDVGPAAYVAHHAQNVELLWMKELRYTLATVNNKEFGGELHFCNLLHDVFIFYFFTSTYKVLRVLQGSLQSIRKNDLFGSPVYCYHCIQDTFTFALLNKCTF